MKHHDKMEQFWRQNYKNADNKPSGWVTFTEAFHKYKQTPGVIEIDAGLFHRISGNFVKSTKKKSRRHGEKLYQVAKALGPTIDEEQVITMCS